MEWIGVIMQNNLAVGVILLLGYIVYTQVTRRQDVKSNGHFTARDREVLQGMSDVMKAFAEASTRYYERGHYAMTKIEEVDAKVEKLMEGITNLTSQILVTNTQLNNAVTQLLSNDKDKFGLLRDLRDRSTARS